MLAAAARRAAPRCGSLRSRWTCPRSGTPAAAAAAASPSRLPLLSVRGHHNHRSFSSGNGKPGSGSLPPMGGGPADENVELYLELNDQDGNLEEWHAHDFERFLAEHGDEFQAMAEKVQRGEIKLSDNPFELMQDALDYAEAQLNAAEGGGRAAADEGVQARVVRGPTAAAAASAADADAGAGPASSGGSGGDGPSVDKDTDDPQRRVASRWIPPWFDADEMREGDGDAAGEFAEQPAEGETGDGRGAGQAEEEDDDDDGPSWLRRRRPDQSLAAGPARLDAAVAESAAVATRIMAKSEAADIRLGSAGGDQDETGLEDGSDEDGLSDDDYDLLAGAPESVQLLQEGTDPELLEKFLDDQFEARRTAYSRGERRQPVFDPFYESQLWRDQQGLSEAMPTRRGRGEGDLRISNLELHEDDLIEQFVRGSGNGGSKLNSTSNCVVLRHIPTGTIVRCHESRSQLQNRKLARKRMKLLLEELVLGHESRLQKLAARRRKQKQDRRRKALKKLQQQEAGEEGVAAESPSLSSRPVPQTDPVPAEPRKPSKAELRKLKQMQKLAVNTTESLAAAAAAAGGDKP